MSIRNYRKKVGIFAVGFLFLSGYLIAQTGKDTPEEKTAQLIEQLGDRQYKKREIAQSQLVFMGEGILPKLRETENDRDLERAKRATATIKQILDNCAAEKHGDVKMVRIGSGRFTMGSPKTENSRRADELQHEVSISEDFLLGKYEVSQAEFNKVMKFNPSYFQEKGGGADKVKGLNADAFPVEGVSWYDAIEYCNQLSELAGYKHYYKLDEVKKTGSSITSAKVTKLGGNGYRLPTEAEWEHACRAESKGSFHFGENPRVEVIHCKPILYSGGYGSSLQWTEVPRTERCGKTAENDWSLADMHGNVAEWCWDWYDREYYEKAPKKDVGGPETGTHRVVRGGSWLVTQYSCRSAARAFHAPDEMKSHIGFRIARTPGPPRPAK